MDEATKQESVLNFCAITGSTPEKASFFLESCKWNIESAVSSFFDHEGQTDVSSQMADHVQDGEDSENDLADEIVSRPVIAAEAERSKPPVIGPSSQSSNPLSVKGKNKAVASSRIKTFSDISKGDDSEEDDDGEEPNEYYTGGEKSGMMVQAPKRDKLNVNDIFERAKQQGARAGTAEDLEGLPRKKQGSFSGRGRTLAGSSEAGVEEETQPPQNEPVVDESLPTRHVITFWRNGFTVDDGPLRRLDDPANASFLSCINRGECPRELAPANTATPLEVSLVKKDEEWTPPPEPKVKAFTGRGQTLGSSSEVATSEPAPSPQQSFQEANVRPHAGLVVDDSQPTTSIQIRLRDGTRLVAKFNHNHTIADIRAFIEASRPGGFGTYQIQTIDFPPKRLTDLSQTVEQAGLLNAVVVQR